MLQGMSNQLEVLRVKDGMTTSYREFYYGRLYLERRNGLEFTNVTSSATRTAKKPTKMVGRKTKWVSPAIIAKRREKRTCFRCGIVGHRMDKCTFLPARRPVATATTTTVIKITGSFTTVDSITNDEMDWESTVTSSFTKMVGRKAKWVSPAIIAEKE